MVRKLALWVCPEIGCAKLAGKPEECPAHAQAAGYALAMTECGLEAPERCVLLGIGEQGTVVEEEGQATADDFLQMLQAYNTKRSLEKRIREAGNLEHEWHEVVV